MRLVWNLKRANISYIRKAIKMVDWRFMFLSKSFFNNNCIPHKCITIDDSDPLWMNETTKNKIKLKKSLHKPNKFIEIQKLSIEI